MNDPFEPPFDEGLDDVNELEKAKSKLITDFGLKQRLPGRVTIEVLQKMIKEKPDRMTRAIREWLRPD